MKLFTFLGTEVRAHWSLLIPFLITVASFTHFMIILMVFTLVVAHEYGHIVMARKFGVDCKTVYLSCIGGMAVLDKEPPTPKAAFLTALAGPAVNIGLVLLAILFVRVVPAYLWVPFVYVNVFMVLFNAIPAFPMDGGRMLNAVLWKLFGQELALRLSVALSVGLATFGALYGIQQGRWILVLISAFVAFAALSSWNERRNEQENLQHPVEEGSRAGWTAPKQDRKLLCSYAPSNRDRSDL